MNSKNNSVKPNLFIVGAPKCGTTSLSEYLRTHPEIFVRKEKEVHYFCFDFNNRYPRPFSLSDYLQRFCDGFGKKVIVDASPWYLYSNCAIKEAYQFNPHAKFIAMIRNPVEVLPSLHRQLINNYDEDESDLLSAWNLESQRKNGINIPEYCREKKLLLYSEVCRFGKQVNNFYSIVPANQRMTILFDDFVSDVHSTYKRVLNFIGVKDDGRDYFPIVNESFQWRFKKFSDFVITPPYFLQRIGKYLLYKTGIKRFGIYQFLYHVNNRLNRKKIKQKPSLEELESLFRNTFADDIYLLGRLLQRDLSGWLK